MSYIETEHTYSGISRLRSKGETYPAYLFMLKLVSFGPEICGDTHKQSLNQLGVVMVKIYSGQLNEAQLEYGDLGIKEVEPRRSRPLYTQNCFPNYDA